MHLVLPDPKNSLLYNFRPALVDFRRVRTQTARQNLEQAFSTAEREFGVTRLLDPEGKHVIAINNVYERVYE